MNLVDARNERSNNAATKKQIFLQTLILGNKKHTSQKKNIWNTYFLLNVGSHAKNQPLLGTNGKTPKMSVSTFLRGALVLKNFLTKHEPPGPSCLEADYLYRSVNFCFMLSTVWNGESSFFGAEFRSVEVNYFISFFNLELALITS